MRSVVCFLAVVVTFPPSALQAAPQRPVRPGLPRVEYPADRGDSKIDVGFYPKEIQASVAFYRRMCSRCHTIARANNTSMTVPQWESYVRERLMKKRNSRIDEMAAEKLLTFLRYDQEQRRDKTPEAFCKPVTLERWFRDGQVVPEAAGDEGADEPGGDDPDGDGRDADVPPSE